MVSHGRYSPSLALLWGILCCCWSVTLVHSVSANPEILQKGFDESSSSNQLVPFQDECVAKIKDTFVAEGIKLELVCSVSNSGLDYSIPLVDANWIIEKTNSGDLVNGKTSLTLPSDTMLNLFTHEIITTELPDLVNDYEAQSEFELAQQNHRRLQTPSVSLVPSRQPSKQPSLTPSMVPSRIPSRQPSVVPSRQPSSQPSVRPSTLASLNPSKQPSNVPSRMPSISPSRVPSRSPSRQPSSLPSFKPSLLPSKQPSIVPSQRPSIVPSLAPSAKPSLSDAPSLSSAPSSNPSGSSQPSKSDSPSSQPSKLPSISPSLNPSNVVSLGPSKLPSLAPSAGPSRIPSLQPSKAPSKSNSPSGKPSSSDAPSSSPSKVPSLTPSLAPSHLPTVPGASARPSNAASASPSRVPSQIPSVLPSILPSKTPTLTPSLSSNPTPSGIVTANPTAIIPIDRTGTVEINIGLDGLDILDSVCTGLEGFIAQAIRDIYGLTITTVDCARTTARRRRRLEERRELQGFLEYEKPILLTVTTKFPDFRTAPREFGFVEFLDNLMISTKAQSELAAIIEQAITGKGIDGVHIAVVLDPQTNKNVLVVAFGNDAPTAAPTENPAITPTTAPVGPAPSTSAAHYGHKQYFVSLLLCAAIAGGMSMVDVFVL